MYLIYNHPKSIPLFYMFPLYVYVQQYTGVKVVNYTRSSCVLYTDQ